MTDEHENDHDLALVVHAHSTAWRRRLGPLAWAALEHLALAAQEDHQGWAAALGVRGVAAGLGVTKDTAAHAVATLTAAGLVARESLNAPDGRRRSGYRLRLPAGLELRGRPDDRDTPQRPGDPDRCHLEHKAHCPEENDDRKLPTNVANASLAAVVCPEDWPYPEGEDGPCPKGEDMRRTDTDRDTGSKAESASNHTSRQQPRIETTNPRRRATNVPIEVVQPSLFRLSLSTPINPEPLNPPSHS